MSLGYFGKGLYGKSSFGGALGPLQVVSASAPNPYTVVIEFDQTVDVTYPPFLDPTNYSIPGLGVISAAFASPTSVQLTTAQQNYALYTVTVGLGRSASGRALDILHRTATFTGHGANPGFFAIGLTRRRVRLVFSTTMRANPALTDPASYALTGLDGSSRVIEDVLLEQQTDVLSLVLVLGPPPIGGDPDLEDDKWYQVEVSPLVITTTLLSLVPRTSLFQWVEALPSLSLDLSQFTGEVQGGLYGTPAGLVFFSPALDVPVANSVIQIEEVDVCTTAYDTYTFPSPPDPFPLYTWSPTSPSTGLGQTGISLWAPFPRLVEARFALTFTGPSMVEHLSHGIDGPATATFSAPWAPGYVALLNNPYYTLGPPGFAMLREDPTPTFASFICTNNLGPIPPGPETTIVLQPPPTMLEAEVVADSFLAELNLSQDLVGYWPADATGLDFSGNGLHLTQSPPSYGPGRFAEAFDLDGETSDPPHRTTYDAILDFPGDFTIALWFYLRAFPKEVLLAAREAIDGEDRAWLLGLASKNDGIIIINTGVGTGAWEVPGLITTFAWHHLVIRRTGGTLEAFLDGAAQLGQSLPGAITTSTSLLYFGNRALPTPHRLDGKVDDAAIWQRALTDAEIAFLASGHPVLPGVTRILMVGDSTLVADLAVEPSTFLTADSTLSAQLGVNHATVASVVGNSAMGQALAESATAYWKFDGTFADATGNGYDLTPQGSALYGGGKFEQAMAVPYDINRIAKRIIGDTAFDLVGDFTISLWCNLDSLQYENDIIAKLGGGGGGPGWTLTIDQFPWDNSIYIYFFGLTSYYVSAVNVTGQFALGVWHHLVVRRSGMSLNFFLDGNLVGMGILPGAQGGEPLLTIGGRSDISWPIDGRIDDVGFWNLALTNDAIGKLWNGGTGRTIDTPLDLNLVVARGVSATMTGGATVNGPSLAASAIAYWKLDYSATDATGNGYDLQSVAVPPSYVAGKFNDAFWMPYEPYYQPSQYALQRPVYDPVFDLPGDFTVSLWFNTNDIISNGENSLIGTYNSNLALPTGWVIFVGGGPGFASLVLYGIQSWPSYYFVSANITAEFTLDTWHHIVARRSAGTISLFFDGVLVATSIGTGASPGGTPLTVGARGSLVRQATGYFDDIGIWDVALTDDDVAWIWNGGAGRPLDTPKPLDLTATAPP